MYQLEKILYKHSTNRVNYSEESFNYMPDGFIVTELITREITAITLEQMYELMKVNRFIDS